MDTKSQNTGDGSSDGDALIGRESDVLPGRFGEELTVMHAQFSRGGGHALPTRPLLLCLHGWGSNEHDMADIMRYLAPYNDYVSLRAPLVLAAEEEAAAGAYSWFHDAVPTGEDRDRDLYAAANAVDRWVDDMIPADRAVVPIGFSQGGALAVHVLRVRPERYRAAVAFSGFVASGSVPGTAPADNRLSELEIPVFFGYGRDDEVMPKYELFAAAAWLEEHTWLTAKGYRGLDHAVSMDELTDVRQWMLLHDIASGVL